jgi:hypothetical protein
MSANAPAPPKDTKKVPDANATLVVPATGFGAILGGMAILPIIFLIVFHAGAAYLSYQKYQSGLWALLDFFFPYLYYPYYAFFLSAQPAPTPVTTLLGGLRKMVKGGRKH